MINVTYIIRFSGMRESFRKMYSLSRNAVLIMLQLKELQWIRCMCI
jgi:hypothetical protein